MHSPVFGAASAKVTIVEFFDPSCETCRAFYPGVKDLVNAHDGKVKLVILYAPFHEGSEDMIKILEAPRMQDKYWPTLETLLRMHPQWASHDNPQPDLNWRFLEESGLDVEKARKDAGTENITNDIENPKSTQK